MHQGRVMTNHYRGGRSRGGTWGYYWMLTRDYVAASVALYALRLLQLALLVVLLSAVAVWFGFCLEVGGSIAESANVLRQARGGR